MNWQSYVDQLMGSEFISMACIAGHDGEIRAKSDEFIVEPKDVAILVKAFDNHSLTRGITLAGKRYIFSSESDNEINAKNDKIGVHCMKTEQIVIICFYEDPVEHEQVAEVVQELGDVLINSGN